MVKPQILFNFLHISKSEILSRGFRIFLLLAFFFTSVNWSLPAQANEIVLPKPGIMVHLSPAYNPALLKGIKVHPDNPLKFEFILDPGDSASGGNKSQEDLRKESTRLIKYFLASLTVPERDLWVNLSPYEKDRIIPESFGQTEMGRNLLAQDYLLKQITSTLMYPEESLGKEFWKKIYAKLPSGASQLTTNVFNKVWIVPDKALVYENEKSGVAYIVKSRLKVMLDTDYVAQNKNDQSTASQSNSKEIAVKEIIKSVILPELEREVNEGKNFAPLRQVYQSLILAQWYKKKIKQSILANVYVDQNKVKGTEYKQSLNENGSKKTSDTDFIYQQYLHAFKKGVYNYVKEERDVVSNQVVPRKYFAGGMQIGAFKVGDFAMTTDSSVVKEEVGSLAVVVDLAMKSEGVDEIALQGFIDLFLKDRNYDWLSDAQIYQDLIGKTIGTTSSTNGSFQITLKPGYRKLMSLTGGKYYGYNIAISKIIPTKNLLNITLRFSKDGDIFERDFQLGQLTENLQYFDRQKMKESIEVLKLDNRIGLEAIERLIVKDVNTDWTKEIIPNMVGMKLGKTTKIGVLALNPIESYPYFWSAFTSPPKEGVSVEGWEAEIVFQNINSNYIEIKVKFSKQGNEDVYKTFQIGQAVWQLTGYGAKVKGQFRKVLQICEHLGSEVIKQVINMDSKEFRDLKIDLTGLPLVDPDSKGDISLTVDGYKYIWSAVGIQEKGWGQGKIISSVKKPHYLEFVVQFTHQQDHTTRTRTFQITEDSVLVSNDRDKSALKRSIRKISMSPGKKAIIDLIRNKESKLINLEGLLIGPLDHSGAVATTLDDEIGYKETAKNIPLLGFIDNGWIARIVMHEKFNDRHEIMINFSKEGEVDFQRVFTIGPNKEILRTSKGDIDINAFEEAKLKTLDSMLLGDLTSVRTLGHIWDVPKETLSKERLYDELNRRLGMINKIRLSMLLYHKSFQLMDVELAKANIRYIAGSMFKLLRVQAGLGLDAFMYPYRIEHFERGQRIFSAQELDFYIKKLEEVYALRDSISVEDLYTYLHYAFDNNRFRLDRKSLLIEANRYINEEKPGELLRLLRMQVFVSAFDGITKRTIANLEAGRWVILPETLKVIIETLQRSYKKDGRLEEDEVEYLLEKVFDYQLKNKRLIKKVSIRNSIKPEFDVEQKGYVVNAINNMQEVTNEQVVVLWQQGKKEEVIESLLYLLNDFMSKSRPDERDLYLDAGYQIITDAVNQYDSQVSSLKLIEFVRKALKEKLDSKVWELKKHLGMPSLDAPLGDLDGNTFLDVVEAAGLDQRGSYEDLIERLSIVRKKISEQIRMLNGSMVQIEEKKMIAKDLLTDLRSRGVISLLDQLSVGYGIYFSGQWGGMAFTRKVDPIELMLVIDNKDQELDGFVAQLADQLKAQQENSRQLLFQSQNRAIRLTIISKHEKDVAKKDDLLELFMNAFYVYENNRNYSDNLARKLFNDLGDDAVDYVFGHYEQMLEFQGRILQAVDFAQLSDNLNTQKITKSDEAMTAQKGRFVKLSESGDISFLDKKGEVDTTIKHIILGKQFGWTDGLRKYLFEALEQMMSVDGLKQPAGIVGPGIYQIVYAFPYFGRIEPMATASMVREWQEDMPAKRAAALVLAELVIASPTWGTRLGELPAEIKHFVQLYRTKRKLALELGSKFGFVDLIRRDKHAPLVLAIPFDNQWQDIDLTFTQTKSEVAKDKLIRFISILNDLYVNAKDRNAFNKQLHQGIQVLQGEDKDQWLDQLTVSLHDEGFYEEDKELIKGRLKLSSDAAMVSLNERVDKLQEFIFDKGGIKADKIFNSQITAGGKAYPVSVYRNKDGEAKLYYRVGDLIVIHNMLYAQLLEKGVKFSEDFFDHVIINHSPYDGFEGGFDNPANWLFYTLTVLVGMQANADQIKGKAFIDFGADRGGIIGLAAQKLGATQIILYHLWNEKAEYILKQNIQLNQRDESGFNQFTFELDFQAAKELPISGSFVWVLNQPLYGLYDQQGQRVTQGETLYESAMRLTKGQGLMLISGGDHPRLHNPSETQMHQYIKDDFVKRGISLNEIVQIGKDVSYQAGEKQARVFYTLIGNKDQAMNVPPSIEQLEKLAQKLHAKILRGEQANSALMLLVRIKPEHTIAYLTLNAIVLMEWNFFKMANALGISVEALKQELGMASSDQFLIIINGKKNSEAEKSLFEEVLHILSAPIQINDHWFESYDMRMSMEKVTDFLELMFNINLRTMYVSWDQNIREALVSHYRDVRRLDPNYDMRRIIDHLAEDIRNGKVLEIDGKSIKIADIIWGNEGGDDFISKYLEIVKEREQFSQMSPLFEVLNHEQREDRAMITKEQFFDRFKPVELDPVGLLLNGIFVNREIFDNIFTEGIKPRAVHSPSDNYWMMDTLFPNNVSFSLSQDDSFDASTLLFYGNQRNADRIVLILNPDKVKDNSHRFQLLGNYFDLKSTYRPYFQRGISKLGFTDQNLLFKSDDAGNDEVQFEDGGIVPPEYIQAIIVHPDRYDEIVRWAKELSLDNLKIYVVNPFAINYEVYEDKAMLNNKTGGIDLTSDKALAIKNDGKSEIKFNALDPAMLQQLQEAEGFEPRINRIELLKDIKVFLGIVPSQS